MILSYARRVTIRLPVAPLSFIVRLICVLMAVVALGGQIATASELTSRIASALVDQGDGAPVVMCGTGHRMTAVRQTPPVRPQPVHLVWVTSSASDAADLLASDQPTLPRPDRVFVRLAGARQGLRGPPDADGVRPYPRGPPILC